MGKRGMTPYQANQIALKNGVKETALKRVRVQKNLSQAELGQLSGVSARTIQYYESGKRKIEAANLETLCNLCAALGCRIENILEDKRVIKKYKAIK